MMNKDNLNSKQEEKQTGGFSDKAKNGLVILATVGIGCGIYGFKLGRQTGYRKGVKDGIVYANSKFGDAVVTILEDLRKPKGK